jgi:hypothetical protein
MDGKKENALVPRPSGTVEKTASGPKRILSGMVSDTLALASKGQRSLATTTFRIDDYEWCEPDFRQILIWAEATGLKPEEVITRLLNQQPNYFPFFEEPPFMDGRLLNVKWEDLRPLQQGRLEWVKGLEIIRLAFIGAFDAVGMSDLGPLSLAGLVWLTCRGLGLHGLDLTGVPRLEYLDCTDNRLEELQLGRVPQLSTLNCYRNELEDLKLDQTPNLCFLACGNNRLAQLDLYGLNRLKALFCGENKLTELKTANLSNLASLDCEENSLRELHLVGVSKLEKLNCSRNQLTKLDLGQCPELRTLYFYGNRLTWLDLSSMQNLKYLDCADNAISDLDLSSCPNLVSVDCAGNPISLLDISELKHLRWLNVSPHTNVIIGAEQQGHIDLFIKGRQSVNYPSYLPPKELDKADKNGWSIRGLMDLLRAVEGGRTEQLRCGLARLYGKGLSKDPLEAYKWLKLATEQGDKDAAEELAFLTSILPSVWLKECDRRYRDFKASR